MKLNGLKINFLGDSITEGANASKPEKAYWRLLGERDGAIVRGYGIGGTRIARQPALAGKADDNFVSRVDGMEQDADVIVVFGGTNDFGHGDAPLGSNGDSTDGTFYGALHALFQALRSRYPLAPVVVLTPLHRKGETALFNRNGIRNVGSLVDYVRIIREVAAQYALPVLDLFHTSGMNPNAPADRFFAADGLHPNDAGHERIYTLLRDFLRRLPM